MKISVIIPSLNESARIAQAVARLRAMEVHEIIVVDCGGDDDTAALADAAGATVLSSGQGRWLQMNTGAEHATGDVLWFVHADVRVPRDSVTHIRCALQDTRFVAGAFRTATIEDIGSTWVRWLLPLADLRSRYTRLPYGDQAVFVRAAAFREVGGFPSQRIMEDLVLAQRLSAMGQIALVTHPVEVSGRRFVAHPVYATWVMYTFPILYRLGVSTNTLERWYGAPR